MLTQTHIWRQVWESSPGQIGERRVLLPLRHPCAPLGKGGTFAHFQSGETWPWANSKHGRVSFQYPVWYIVRINRFLSVNARKSLLNLLNGDDILIRSESGLTMDWREIEWRDVLRNFWLVSFSSFITSPLRGKLSKIGGFERPANDLIVTFPPFRMIVILVGHRFIEESASLRAHFLQFVAIGVVSKLMSLYPNILSFNDGVLMSEFIQGLSHG